MGEVTIITTGERTGSPYPWRKRFDIDVHGTIEELYGLWKLLLFVEYPRMSFSEYVLFCKYCKLEFSPFQILKCLRHQTVSDVMQLIGNESNYRYIYRFNFDYNKDKIEFEFNLGKSGWIVTGDNEKIVVRRPNGKIFTYRNHGVNSSYRYILKAVFEFIDEVMKMSYRYISI